MKTSCTHLIKQTALLSVLMVSIQFAVKGQIVTSSNVALNKPATASSVLASTFTALKAFDGDKTTYFSSAYSDTEWIYVDLGRSYQINNVVLAWEKAYGKDFNILFSVNGTFTDLYADSIQIRNNAASPTGLSVTNTIKTKGNTIARYVRMQGVHSATGNGYSLYEFQVSGSTYVSSMLPVTVIGFTAAKANGITALQWATTTEFNNAGFSIERSMDGSNFSAIGWVASINAGTNTTNYSFTDRQTLSGKNYYRLKLIDLSGQSAYSTVVAINAVNNNVVKTYPVPVKDHLVVEYSGTTGENINIALLNGSGQPIYTSQQVAQGSQQTMVIPRAGNMMPGIYFLSISSASKKYSQQITLQ